VIKFSELKLRDLDVGINIVLNYNLVNDKKGLKVILNKFLVFFTEYFCMIDHIVQLNITLFFDFSVWLLFPATVD
jgi:hypothetical protein